jgi:hypothetical protein
MIVKWYEDIDDMDRSAYEAEYKLLFNLDRDHVPALAAMTDTDLVRQVVFVRKMMERVKERYAAARQ